MAQTQGLILALRSPHSASFVELQQSFPSQVQVISTLVDQLMRFILRFRSADGSEIDIETALREALANAVVHGNRENPSKRVYVECRCYTNGEISITVRDERLGFDSNSVPDPTTPEGRLWSMRLHFLCCRVVRANPSRSAAPPLPATRPAAALRALMGMEEVLAVPRSPWQNPFVERLVGSIRRKCLDRVIVWNERSLRRTLHSYFSCYQRSRTHLALGKDSPEPRAVEPPEQGRVVAIPQVGGITPRIPAPRRLVT